MSRLVVIGGGAAGMSAASAARRVAPRLDVVVCEAGGFAAYGMCGIPYFLGGTVPRAEDLLAYPPSEFRDQRGIDLRLHTRVSAIDPVGHRVQVTGDRRQRAAALRCARGGQRRRAGAAAGAGAGRSAGFTIRSLDEAIGLRRLLEGGTVRRAIVVGAGYIGLEAAEALVCAGAEVEVVEALPRVLGNVDEPIAALAQAELERHTRVWLGTRLEELRHSPHDESGRRTLTAVLGGTEVETDLVVVAAGVRPATGLLVRAGADHLPDGSLLADASMRTSLPDVYAAGDCVALQHLVLGEPGLGAAGAAANKTGRVAGTVAAGGEAAFPGIVGTAVVKVFDLEVARTGLTLAEAQAAGLAAIATDVVSRSRAKYYPGRAAAACPAGARNGRLLGGQLAGREEGAGTTSTCWPPRCTPGSPSATWPRST